MSKEKKPLWQIPWRYRESIVFLSGIFIIGIVLQLVTGSFPYSLVKYPVNLFCGGAIVAGLILLSFWSNHYIYKWISGIPFSITIIGFFLFLALMMGITPQVLPGQNIESKDWLYKIGFRKITYSWSFVLIYFFTLISLGALIAKRLKKFKGKDYAFYLNHIGLWVILFFGGLGAADIERFQMKVEEGRLEWKVYNDKKNILELPVAIQLNDFVMEEYEPKLVVIDGKNGSPLPQDNPVYFQIDNNNPQGMLAAGYQIQVKKYIHDGMRKGDSYEERKMTGSCPAVWLEVKNNKTGYKTEGWVSSGSPYILYKTIKLPDNLYLVMTQPEPKKFLSDITVYTPPKLGEKEGEIIPYKLEVNKPLKIKDWTIYQYGYDTNAGKWSTYSTFELVFDPWVYYVYGGMFMLALGCIGLLWKGNKKTVKNDLG